MALFEKWWNPKRIPEKFAEPRVLSTEISSDGDDEEGGGSPKESMSEAEIQKIVDDLRAAHARWKGLPETTRGKFNPDWLKKNARGLHWQLSKKGGIQHFVGLAGGDVEEDFEKRFCNKDRTEKSVIGELRAAHAKWKELPKDKRGKFNITWLEANEGGLIAWMRTHGGVQHFVGLAGGDVKKGFEKLLQNKDRTEESVVKELCAAHARWKGLPEPTRGRFNPDWLKKNAIGLKRHMSGKGDIQHFVNLAGGDVEEDFEKRFYNKGRTEKFAIGELRAAHAKWKELPNDERGKFNRAWLEAGDWQGLVDWMRTHGGVQHFVDLAGGDVGQDYKEQFKSKDHTEESVIGELRDAHAKWKSSPEDGRGKFNGKWLIANKKEGLVSWMRTHGGIQHFVYLAGEDVKKDFSYGGVGIEKKLGDRLEAFAQEVSDGRTVIAQHFRSLIRAFGGASCADLLFAFRPEYKGLPADRVKGIIATYLGDFLVVHGPIDKGDVDAAIEHLSNLTLRESFAHTLKEDCFAFMIASGREGRTVDGELALAYRGHVKGKFGHLSHPVFSEMVDEVVAYFQSLWSSLHRPEHMVSAISKKRRFPDINQRINIKELQEKKRLLIADEMGLGKSASVILAKEMMGVPCAIVVVPSNVLATWERYLSDEDGAGYFKKGKAPRVCVVEDPRQLETASAGGFDYVLISQERLNERYVGALKKIDCGMLIVDEVHRLKSLKGKRTECLMELAGEMKDDAYVALLSGTPVPNKIQDIAVSLKLLYPKKFASIDHRVLVRSIIRGDLIDLRSLLIPHMQMKRLQETIEMPKLTENVVEVALSDAEAAVYEVLLEGDEQTATEKMIGLREFLLNVHSVEADPDFSGSKIVALGNELREAFKAHDKVVVFVNDYIEGIIRGEHSIIERLDIPSDIEIQTVHGQVSPAERADIEQRVREKGKRLLLFVSGQTADVGVDYSAADRVIFYNDPWTEYIRRQELGRVYRPGLGHDLESTTLVAKGTIEEGIHAYIEQKYRAVEKLLRGIPISELEKDLLTEDEQNTGSDLSVNPELARYYFSAWDKMMRMFGYVKEIGEEDFKVFLKSQGKEYAEGYRALGDRCYHANANRVSGTIIDRLVRGDGRDPSTVRILDMASGPEMLRKHMTTPYQSRVMSMDINPEHFEGSAPENITVGSMLQMPFPDKTFDFLNLSLSLHYTNFVPSKGKLERLKVFQEMNRVLKPGGVVVLNLIYSYPFRNMDAFREAVSELGFTVVEEYTGEATNGNQYHSHVVTLKKREGLDPALDTEDLYELLGKERADGLKFIERDIKLRKTRLIATEVEINGRGFDIEMNERDRDVFIEERTRLVEAEALREKYNGVDNIPIGEIVERGFVRIRVGEKYVLFKKLEKGPGAIFIR